MRRKVRRGAVAVCLCALLLLTGCHARPDPWRGSAAWSHDGTWQVELAEEGVLLRTDETKAHNRIAWLNLPRRSYRGWTIKAQVRTPVPFAHGDLFLVDGDPAADREKVLHELAEVWSFGSVPDTAWREVSFQVTTDKPVSTLGMLAWGWSLDLNLPIGVRNLRLEPPTQPVEWFAWPQEGKIAERVVARHPVRDFFPFGFYVAADIFLHRANALGVPMEQVFDQYLGDMAARGMNLVYFTNVNEDWLPMIAALCARHGLRYTADVGGASPKASGGAPETFATAKRLVEAHRDDQAMLTWVFGEEYDPSVVSRLDGYYRMVHETDPAKTISTIHYRVDAILEDSLLHDVRVVYRDTYPFFRDAVHGPVAYEAQINYYESEMDLAWRMAPTNAAVWAMPQACNYWWRAGAPIYTLDRPNLLRVQAWAALAWGARGVVYFHYAGVLHDENGELRWDLPTGVLTEDWKPSPWLEEATELARQLKAIAGVLVRLERTNRAIESDHRDLRAYLLEHVDTGELYVIAYNRNVEQNVTGRIRVPMLLEASVTILGSGGTINTQNRGGHGIVPVTIAPGDGVVLKLNRQ